MKQEEFNKFAAGYAYARAKGVSMEDAFAELDDDAVFLIALNSINHFVDKEVSEESKTFQSMLVCILTLDESILTTMLENNRSICERIADNFIYDSIMSGMDKAKKNPFAFDNEDFMFV